MTVGIFCISNIFFISLLLFVIFEQLNRALLTDVRSARYKNLAHGLVLAQNSKLPQRITPSNKVKLRHLICQWDNSSIITSLLSFDSPTVILRELTVFPS